MQHFTLSTLIMPILRIFDYNHLAALCTNLKSTNQKPDPRRNWIIISPISTSTLDILSILFFLRYFIVIC